MSRERAKKSLTWILLRIRPLLRILKNFRGSPEAIAGGFSLGLFLAFTPTVGVQILLAVFFATLLKVSRPASLIGVMVTNPLTVPPIFTFNYWVGNLFLDGPLVRDVYHHFLQIAGKMAKLDFWEVGELIKAFSETGREMLLPLILGSIIVATLVGAVSYIFLARALWFLKRHSERRKISRENKQK